MENDKVICIKVREFFLKVGYYVYVGFVMNLFEKRVERYFREDKKFYWYIDYFFKEVEFLRVYLILSEERFEERFLLEVLKFGELVEGFGVGDVRVSINFYCFEEEFDKILVGVFIRFGFSWKIVKSVEEILE